MSDLSQLNVNGTDYDLKDAAAREAIERIDNVKGSQVVTGEVVTTTDAADMYAEEVTVDVEAQQDLNGYDKPWVAGAGRNKLPLTASTIKATEGGAGTWTNNEKTIDGITYTIMTNSAGSVVGIKANGTASAESRCRLVSSLSVSNMILNGCPSGGSTSSGYCIALTESGFTIYADTGSGVSIGSESRTFYCTIIITRGTTVSDKIFYPMLRLSSDSDASFVPYENVCPIQGYDIVSVDRCGRNLFDKDSSEIVATSYLFDDGSIGTPSSNWKISGWCPIIGGYPLTLYNQGSATAPAICWYDLNKNFIGGQAYNGVSSAITVTPPKYAAYVRFSCHKDYVNTAQLEIGSQATTYTAFTGNDKVNIQLGNKNLLPMTVEGIKAANTTGTWSGNVYSINNGTITLLTDENGLITGYKVNGTFNATTYFNLVSTNGTSLNAGSYTLTGGKSSNLYIYDNGSVSDTGSGATFALSSTTSKRFIIRAAASTAFSNVVVQPLLRNSSVVDPTFSPYNPTLGDMVYGGQLTLNDDGSAVFVGTYGKKKISELSWGTSTSSARTFYADLSGYLQSENIDVISSAYNYIGITDYGSASLSDKADGSLMFFYNATQLVTQQIYIKDMAYTDAASFKSGRGNEEIVYKLATPFTIHLSAEQLKLLQGTNNLWSNAGDVTLKYQPDNVIAEPKADVQRLRDDVDDRLVGNACRNLCPQTDVTVANNERVAHAIFDLPLSAGTYSLSAIVESTDIDSNQCLIIGFDSDNVECFREFINRSKNRTSLLFTISTNLRDLAFYASVNYNAGANDSALFKDIQVERGSSPSPYEEYYPSNRELYNKTLVNKIARIPITSANAWINTGLFVTIPANSFYAIHAVQIYSYKTPSGVLLSTSTNPDRTFEYMDISDYANCHACGYTPSEFTLYFYIKAESTHTTGNDCAIRGWYEPAIYKNVVS